MVYMLYCYIICIQWYIYYIVYILYWYNIYQYIYWYILPLEKPVCRSGSNS